jgi:hypothetical protein
MSRKATPVIETTLCLLLLLFLSFDTSILSSINLVGNKKDDFVLEETSDDGEGRCNPDGKRGPIDVVRAVDHHLIHNSISFYRNNYTIRRWMIQGRGG